MKTILITGSCGFVGKNLLYKLINKENYNIIATYYNKKPGEHFKKKNNLKFIKIDLTKAKHYERLPRCINYIIHLAANRDSLLNSKEGEKQIFSNYCMTQNLLNFSKQIKCKYFIFFSSVYIYSGVNRSKFIESFTPIPKEPLGLSKYICENIIKKATLDSNLKCISFRTFTTYGPFSSSKQLVSSSLKKILSKKSIIKFGNSKMKRDFIYIDDVTKAIEISLIKIKKVKNIEIINLGYGKSLTVKECVDVILKVAKIKKKIVYNDSKKLNQGDTDHIGDFKKIKKFLNWHPSISFQSGISKLLRSK
tara:strand:+ start:1784 stop:2704 length:921 start_codon:yes stop_codon:yes gene_type:complete